EPDLVGLGVDGRERPVGVVPRGDSADEVLAAEVFGSGLDPIGLVHANGEGGLGVLVPVLGAEAHGDFAVAFHLEAVNVGVIALVLIPCAAEEGGLDFEVWIDQSTINSPLYFF